MRDRGQPDEIAVPLAVPDQQDEVMVVGGSVRRALLFSAITEGDVGLAADDRFDPPSACQIVEMERAVQVSMIRERQRRHPELGGAIDEHVQLVRAVEKGVFAVCMKVDERHPAHPAAAHRNEPSSISSCLT